MSEHPNEARLDAFVEDLLDARERADVEAHVAGCARCQGEVAAMRALLDAMRALPRSLEPGVDLRPEIRAARHDRVQARARRSALRSLRAPLAAAAVLLVLVTAGVTTAILGTRMIAREVAVDLPTREPVSLVDFERSRADHVRTADELAAILERHRADLSPETVALVEENLRTIDRALREAEAALRADPAAPGVRDLILATHERKVDVLRWANDLTRS